MVQGIWRLPFASSTLPPFDHTNGWLLEHAGRAVLIDPGFRDRGGLTLLDAALAEAGANRLDEIWLTHTHRDHREGLEELLRRWPGLMTRVHRLEADRLELDAPVISIEDGQRLWVGSELGGRAVDVLHTPGHSPGHVAYSVPDVGWILAGDLVAGHGSVWVGAPEGDVAAYVASLDRLANARPRAIGPGHGDPLLAPLEALSRTREHRLDRERQILRAVKAAGAPATVEMLRASVYPDLAPGLTDLAERTLIVHLRKLSDEGAVERVGSDERGPYRVAT